MKISKHLVFVLLIMLSAMLFSSCGGVGRGYSMPRLAKDSSLAQARSIINPDSEVRGVWIASVFNIDYPSRTDLNAASLKGEIDDVLNTCEKYGLNTVFFQVRPACDALYKSDIFPVSSFLNSGGELLFDPLEYIVREGHRRNIFVHAWINPLRVTVSKDSEEKLPDNSPAKLHPEWTVKYADGKVYLNAGLPEVTELVKSGVSEIVSKYDVDGVVFDDYFYPYPVDGAQFDDGEAYKKHGAEFDNVADWRRNNINSMIKASYDAVKRSDPDCLFGVSPCGVWQNNNGSNGGSDTRGFEGYTSLYCDALAWIEGGYIDYISPQIYWQTSSAATPYDTLSDWWNAALDGSGVDLIISHAAYRYEDGDWEEPSGEMTRQIEYSRSALAYRGSMFYGYDEVSGNVRGVSAELDGLYTNEIVYCDPSPVDRGVMFDGIENGGSAPAGELTVSGHSDPALPLLADGLKLSRGKDGSFTVKLTVNKGSNSYEFKQGEKTYTLELKGE